jgi:hypothetical protein
MDITQTELKAMKAKQLRRIIREAIQEILTEDQAADKKAQDSAKQAETAKLQALQKKKSELSKAVAPEEKPAQDAEKMAVDKEIAQTTKKIQKLNKPGLGALELDEMARTAKGFRLADDNVDVAQYANKRVSGVSLQDIISYFRENPGADKKSLQSQFNFVRPQIANAVVNALLDAGVLVKLGAGGEVEATPEPGETAPTQATEPEDLFMGSGENPLSMYFDNEPNDDGSEDFTDNVEPETDELEKAEPTTSKMSDADYEAFMKYDDLSQRLAATKSNIIKLKRRKGGSPGDLTDKPSTELVRLRDLKASLEDRINALVAGSDYLKKKIEKQTGKAYVEPVVEPEETEEEPLDEWTIGKLQYYAGIKK